MAYTPISTTVLTSNTATVSFTSFSGYQDLVLRISARDTTASGGNTGAIGIRLNGAAVSSGYYRSLTTTTPGTVAAESSSSSNAYVTTNGCDGSNGYFFSSVEIHIPDYAEAVYRTIRSIAINERDTNTAKNSWGSNQVYTAAAITQIEVLSNDTFVAGSRFTLYGLG